MLRQDVIFRNVYTRRIGCLVGITELLQRYLTPTREKPVDEDLGGIRVWRLTRERECTAAHGEGRAFLPRARVENFDRQSLILRLEGARAAEADRESALRQPVYHLSRVAADSNLLAAEELADESGTQLRMVIEKLHGPAHFCPGPRIKNDDLAAPLGFEQIKVGSEFLGVYEFRIVVKLCVARVGNITKHVLALRIEIAMSAAVPQ